jgi:RNA polymerase sigma factor (sigma-70 family)
MATPSIGTILQHLRRLNCGAALLDLTDRQLLDRFVAQGEEVAFSALVRRHGPLVFGVCRRVLSQVQDAEDAFQATFLVLSRKAGCISWRERVDGWLYATAYRIALKAKTRVLQRRMRETPMAAVPESATPGETACRDLCAILDEELQHLPKKPRLALIRCYLEGQGQEEAARHLGWSPRTLRRRLGEGKEQLRQRLMRRGLTLSGTLLITGLHREAWAVSPTLALTTVRAATRKAALGTLSAKVIALTEVAGLPPAFLTKGQLGVVLLLSLLLTAGVGLGLAARWPPIQPPPPDQALIFVEKLPSTETPKPRADQYGDALPDRALARLGTVRLRHKDMVASAAFTGDGKTVIAADSGGNLVYWDVSTGKEVRRVAAHRGAIYALAVSSDGGTLASGGRGEVGLWETATAKPLARWKVDNDAIMQLAFTPDAKTLAMRQQGATITLWDVATRKKLHDLQGHKGNVSSISMSPDGKSLASASYKDPAIRLWEVATGKEIRQIEAHKHEALWVAFSPDGKTLASSGNDNTLRFWDPATGKEKKQSFEPAGLQNLVYLPDGKHLAGLSNGGLTLRDATTGKEVRAFEKPLRQSSNLAVSPDGKTLVTSWGGPHTLDLWEVATGKRINRFEGHGHGVTSITFSADGRSLYSAGSITDPPVREWDVTLGKERRAIVDNPNGAECVALSPDGTLLAACEYSIRLFNPVTAKEVRALKGHGSVIVSVAFSADGKTLVSGSYYDQTIRVWEVATGKQLQLIKIQQDRPCAAALAPDGKSLAAGGYNDGSVRIWDAATGKEVGKLATGQHTVHSLAYTPDGRSLAVGGMEEAIGLYDVATGKLVRRFEGHQSWIGQLTFSIDGRTLVSGSGDNTLRLWEVATGQERGRFSGHTGAIRSVALSRNGRMAASGSKDTSILIWDATGRLTKEAALPAAPTVKELESLWANLASADAAKAYQALWGLIEAQSQSVPFLAKRLNPVVAATAEQEKRIVQLVADLDKDAFAEREKAAAELERLGRAAGPELRKLLKGNPTAEVKRRMEMLLEKWADSSLDQVRELRALEALEHINTSEARQIVVRLTKGVPEEWLTREAQTTLERMARP